MLSDEDFQAAGLYDPVTDADTGRRELLRWLEAEGFTIEEMVAAHGWAGLGALASDRRAIPGERLTDEQALEIAGIDREQFTAVTQAFGFVPWVGPRADDLGLTEAEVTTISLFAAFSPLFSPEETLSLIRVIGSSLARIAEAAVSVFLTDVESPHLASGGDELELAHKVLDAVGLLDDLVPALEPALRRHVLQAIERTRLSTVDDIERLHYRYAVGFVDLVGFTPISQTMSAQQLRVFMRDFEGRAHDSVTAAGARLVKLIGDEVMFVAPDADSAYGAAEILMTDLVSGLVADVQPRGGLAYGQVLVRGGDYYGGVVNLASRLADQAVPQELLITESFAQVSTDHSFEPAGRRMLKGFAEPVPVLAARFD